MLHVNDEIALPEDELTWTYARSGGPGGQNVNKVASKATLRWDLAGSPHVPPAVKARLRAAYPAHVTTAGEFLVTSQKYRDQERNRQDCRDKLAAMVRRAAVAPTPRKKTRPTLGSKQRRLAEKRHQSQRRARREVGND